MREGVPPKTVRIDGEGRERGRSAEEEHAPWPPVNNNFTTIIVWRYSQGSSLPSFLISATGIILLYLRSSSSSRRRVTATTARVLFYFGSAGRPINASLPLSILLLTKSLPSFVRLTKLGDE